MISIAHIVNPVIVDESSDLYYAQPITFETMRRAKEAVQGQMHVSLYSAQFAEDQPVVPPDFIQTPDLQRSVLDIGRFREKRKLPLLGDILERLYAAAEVDYLIYTNVDIGLQTHFYQAVQELIRGGTDAFVINRRTIPHTYTSIDQLPEMYAEQGLPHRGWDCFIFPRQIFPRFYLGNVCVGATRVGLALLANMVAYGQRFQELTEAHLTFHIGDDRYWINPIFQDYDDFNTRQVMEILQAIEADVGPFPRESIPGQFLWRKRTLGPIYEYWARHVYLPSGLSRLLNRLAGRRSS